MPYIRERMTVTWRPKRLSNETVLHSGGRIDREKACPVRCMRK